MKIIDVSNWEIATDVFTSGKREKKWIHPPELPNEHYLLKFPEAEGFGEVYAEVIAYLLAENIFGLSVPKSQFAQENGRIAVLSKSFIDKKVNTESLAAMDFFGPDFDATDLYQYTIEKSCALMVKHNLLKEFLLMCIFDYLIANQDRHSENWELLTNNNISPKYIFSPMFDNGSSLFSNFNYGDVTIDALLTDKKQFVGYNNRAKSIFSITNIQGEVQKRPKALRVLKYLFDQDKSLFIECFSYFEGTQYQDIYDHIKLIDNEILEENRKKLICKLIIYRINQVKSLIKEGVNVHGSE